MNQVGKINLLDLQQGMIGLTPVAGEFFAEAASVCLECQNHSSPAKMEIHHLQKLRTQTKSTIMVTWRSADDTMRRTWNDLIEATEYGACAIAALIVQKLKGLSIVRRSARGTGFDFWLGETVSAKSGSSLFQESARLEVSGVLKGASAIISKRVGQKRRQTMRSTGTLPALVVVVEFSKPQSHVDES